MEHPEKQPIRVLLADDHPLVRTGLRATLEEADDIQIVGEATTGTEILPLCDRMPVDVLLLDLKMPALSPLEVVLSLAQTHPQIRVLILTGYQAQTQVRALLGAGVAGYMLKSEASETVVNAVRAVMHGGKWLSYPILEELKRGGQGEMAFPATLSDQERLILSLIAQGLDNFTIAERLHLAPQTVRNYISRIYSKMSFRSRAEAITWARSSGLHQE